MFSMWFFYVLWTRWEDISSYVEEKGIEVLFIFCVFTAAVIGDLVLYTIFRILYLLFYLP